MKMSELEAHAQFCIMNKLPLSVSITKSTFPVPEQVIHPFENIPSQMELYKMTLDENCKHKDISGFEIIAVVDPQEQTLLTGEAQLLPYVSTMLENHVRVEDGYVIGSREKQIVVEGKVDDVLKILQYFESRKVESLND